MLLRLLPGLYLAALGWLLGAAVRRWYEPLPRRVVLAFLALVLALLHPVLLGGQALLPLDILRGYPPFADLPAPAVHGNYLQEDLLTLILPAQVAVRAAFARGEWPLWNHAAAAGMPLLGDPQSQALQPLALVALPLSPLAAPGLVAGLRILLALLGTWLFLRRLRLDEGAALVGALAWGLGGFVQLWLGWPLANAAAWLPLAAWATVRVVEEGRRRDVVALALATSALALAGQPEVVLYGFALVALVALDRARAAGGTRRRLGRWLAAAALGGLLAAPALLPAVPAAAASQRAAQLAARGHGPVAGPLADAERTSWGTVLRQRWVPLVAPNAFGNDRYLHYWGGDNVNEDASGFVGSAALLLALAGLFAPRAARRPAERTLQWVLPLSLLALALPPALHPWLDRLPPPLASPSHHHRLLLVAGFALACLAACELDRRLRAPGGRGAVVAGVAVLLAGGVVWGYLAHPHPTEPATLEVLRDGWLRWQLRVLAIAAAALLLAPRLGVRRWLAAPFALLVGFELLLAHVPANPAAPPLLRAPPALAGLRERLQPPMRIVVADEALPYGVAALWGLADVRPHNPMTPAACAAALAPLHGLTGNALEAAAARRLRRLLGAGGVVGAGETVGPGGWRPLAGPPGARVFVDPSPLPLVWLPGSPRAPDPWWRLHPARLSVELVPPAPGVAADGRWLATSLCADAGWRALVDGRPHPTLRLNGPFVGAWLPPGTRRVELVQRPRGFVVGAVAGGLGLATLLLVLAAPPRRRRALEA